MHDDAALNASVAAAQVVFAAVLCAIGVQILEAIRCHVDRRARSVGGTIVRAGIVGVSSQVAAPKHAKIDNLLVGRGISVIAELNDDLDMLFVGTADGR